MDIILLLACMLIVVIAGLVQGITGSGSALVMVPFLSLFFVPKEVVPVTLILGTVLNLTILAQSYKHVRLKLVVPMTIASAIAIPLGTLLLLWLPAYGIRIFMGLVIIPFSIAMMIGWSMRIENETAASIPVGFVSGILNGSVTMSGPPVIMFLQNQGLQKEDFRASLVAFFLATNVVAFVTFAIGGLFTAESIELSAMFLPAVAAGLAGGIVLAKRLPEGRFRKLALLLLIAAGVSSLISGIIGVTG